MAQPSSTISIGLQKYWFILQRIHHSSIQLPPQRVLLLHLQVQVRPPYRQVQVFQVRQQAQPLHLLHQPQLQQRPYQSRR